MESQDSGMYLFELFIDDWSFPKTDEHIALDYGKSSLENKLKEYITEGIKKDLDISIASKSMMKDKHSRRKRFIDVLTSIISRAFRDRNDSKYDTTPVEQLKSQLKTDFNIEDSTNEVIIFLNDFMYKDIQETKEKEKTLLVY